MLKINIRYWRRAIGSSKHLEDYFGVFNNKWQSVVRLYALKLVFTKKKLLKSKGNLCSIFFKIETILALNVWQKICLEFSWKYVPPLPSFSVEFRKTCVIVNLPKLSYNIENGGKGVDISYLWIFAKIKCQDCLNFKGLSYISKTF